MLNVKTPEEASQIIHERFAPLAAQTERVALQDACGRVLHTDIVSAEYVPGFDRSTVDGYAVIASDTFGCSEGLPALLTVAGEVLMGKAAESELVPGSCIAMPTGGDLPDGADAVVMVEHTEDYGDGLIGITSPVAPGNNIIFRGDDVSPGKVILMGGTLLAPHDIGILSALGLTHVDVRRRPLVGVISTGDELVDTSEVPGRGQIRDVNMPLLLATVGAYGAEGKDYGIVDDNEPSQKRALARAIEECDVVLISGGSSAGMKDLTSRIIEDAGALLFHGIAMKPGKPTILGDISGKPVFGLPGHPVAAYFVTELFVRPLIERLLGCGGGGAGVGAGGCVDGAGGGAGAGGVGGADHGGNGSKRRTVSARLSEAVSANHGRAEYLAVILERGDTRARPIRGKSGLIASLAHTDGYICIPRDQEGLPEGAEVSVTLWM